MAVESLYFENRPIVLLGAGSGLGESLARRFAREGYQVIAGMRSEGHFAALRANIAADGGVEPKPLLADITDEVAFGRAFDGLNLSPSTKLHYFPVAAGGIEGVGSVLLRQIAGLRRAARNNGLSKQMVDEATAVIKAEVLKDEVIEAGMEINVRAPVRILDELDERGHIDDGTDILTTSSSLSEAIDLNNLDQYPGPWFYYVVALTKKTGANILREKARNWATGTAYLDAVAPELPDTGVGKMIDTMVEVLQAVNPNEKIVVPKVSRVVVADAIYRELVAPKDRIRTMFVEESGVSYQRPDSWNKPFLPYL